MRGDDVTSLQERLLELGYDAGRADGILGPETEIGPARLPARLRPHLRRHLRPGHPARAAPAGPEGHRRPPAAAAPERLVRRQRPAPDRPAHRRRPRPRRRGDRLHRGGDHRGRPGVRPRLAHRGPARRRRRHGLPDPRPAPEPVAGRADRLRQRRPRRPVRLPAHGRAQLRARPRGGQLLLRHRLGRLLHGGRAVRQPGPPRGDRAHRHARPRLAPQDLGPAADDPHARRPARLRLPLPPGRPAAAARRPAAQHRSPTPSWPPSSGSTCPPRPTRPPEPSSCPPTTRGRDGSGCPPGRVSRDDTRRQRRRALTLAKVSPPVRPSAGDAPDAHGAHPHVVAAAPAAGPAGGPVRSTHARHEDVGDPRAVLRGQPARGRLAGRRHARGHRPARSTRSAR